MDTKHKQFVETLSELNDKLAKHCINEIDIAEKDSQADQFINKQVLTSGEINYQQAKNQRLKHELGQSDEDIRLKIAEIERNKGEQSLTKTELIRQDNNNLLLQHELGQANEDIRLKTAEIERNKSEQSLTTTELSREKSNNLLLQHELDQANEDIRLKIAENERINAALDQVTRKYNIEKAESDMRIYTAELNKFMRYCCYGNNFNKMNARFRTELGWACGSALITRQTYAGKRLRKLKRYRAHRTLLRFFDVHGFDSEFYFRLQKITADRNASCHFQTPPKLKVQHYHVLKEAIAQQCRQLESLQPFPQGSDDLMAFLRLCKYLDLNFNNILP